MSELRHINPVRDSGHTSSNSDVNLMQILGTLWRGKWLLFLIMALTVALSIFWLFQVATPRFTATAVVMLQNRNEQVLDFDNVLSGLGSDQNSINTEVEVLRARGLVEKVVMELDLQNDPEFNWTLRPEDPWQPAVLIRDAKGLLGFDITAVPPSERKIRDDTIDAVLGALTISNVRRSYVFRITAKTEDPEKSALLADALANIYISDQIQTKFSANERATAWLAEQIGQLEVELEVAENAVKAFDVGSNLISPQALAQRARQLKDFRDRQSSLALQRDSLTQRTDDLIRARNTGDPARMVQVALDERLGLLFNTLSTGGRPAREIFDARVAGLIDQAQLERGRVNDQILTLQGSITSLEVEVEAQSEELLQLQQLERVANATRLVYEYFLGRQKEISAQRGIQQPDSRLLSRAVVPDKAASPRKTLVVLLAAAIGFIIGSAILLIRELRNSSFRTSEELEAVTGLPVMGEIARAPSTRRRRLLDIISSQPNSALVEAIRNLRTTILLSNPDNPPKVIMLTSSVPGEGKTTQSLGLAQNLASMDKRVLVIEGDIRRRTLREYFDTTDERGIFSAVTQPDALLDIIHYSDLLGIDVILGEESKRNAADFFSSGQFNDFIERMRQRYDFIVIDTPPVLAVPDARVIGQAADVVLYVVHWDNTPRWQVRKGLRAFQTVHVPVNGIVLSQVNQRSMRRYGYHSNTKSYYSTT